MTWATEGGKVRTLRQVARYKVHYALDRGRPAPTIHSTTTLTGRKRKWGAAIRSTIGQCLRKAVNEINSLMAHPSECERPSKSTHQHTKKKKKKTRPRVHQQTWADGVATKP